MECLSTEAFYKKASLFVGKHEMLQLPLKFVLCYSGFSLDHAKYSAFYQPHIQTPTLHREIGHSC